MTAVRQPSAGCPPGAMALVRSLVAAAPAVRHAGLARAELDTAAAAWLAARGLAPLAYFRLQEHGLIEQQPPQVRNDLRGAFHAAAAAEAVRARELEAVLDALAAVGVTPVLYKGVVLAYLAYPSPACRPMGDLDLWVAREQMPRAQAALAEIGYGACPNQDRPAAWQERHDGEIALLSGQPWRTRVELHWGVFSGEWLQRAAAIDAAAIRQRLVPIQVAGRPALGLAAEDAVVQLAAHLSVNHQMAFMALRGLVDIALLAQATGLRWEPVAQRARDWRLHTATWAVLDLLAELLGVAQAGSASASLAPPQPRRWLLRRLVSGRAVLAGPELTRGRWRLLFLLLLADRTRDALALLGAALWPTRDWLGIRYGQTAWSVRARHLAAAIRGRA